MTHTFALILLDISMPEMDGFETARFIREHPRFERTPIIFITGIHVSELDTLRGYEAGAIDYIAVPVVPEILRSKVALLVELYRRRAQLENLNRDLETARAGPGWRPSETGSPGKDAPRMAGLLSARSVQTEYRSCRAIIRLPIPLTFDAGRALALCLRIHSAESSPHRLSGLVSRSFTNERSNFRQSILESRRQRRDEQPIP